MSAGIRYNCLYCFFSQEEENNEPLSLVPLSLYSPGPSSYTVQDQAHETVLFNFRVAFYLN